MNHVYEALAQVRTIHRHIREKQRFKGYSGRARAISGCLALAACLWLVRTVNQNQSTALATWIVVAVLSIALNYGAVLPWYLGTARAERQASILKPMVEAFPAILVGGVLTLVLIRIHAANELPAVWMLLYGLANFSSRRVVSKRIVWVAAFYLIAGALMALVGPANGLLNPWPMGLVFFIGEWLGGLIIHFDERESGGWSSFWGLPLGKRTYE